MGASLSRQLRRVGGICNCGKCCLRVEVVASVATSGVLQPWQMVVVGLGGCVRSNVGGIGCGMVRGVMLL